MNERGKIHEIKIKMENKLKNANETLIINYREFEKKMKNCKCFCKTPRITCSYIRCVYVPEIRTFQEKIKTNLNLLSFCFRKVKENL